jgi:xanthine dehydrogenase accessory factor
MADWTQHARECLREGPAALITILATEGSAPRGPGARMVVTKSGLKGTIGGGALEYQAMAQARAILALDPGSWRVQDYPLGPLLGQCCGGRVRLLVEHLAEVPDRKGRFEVTLSERVERRPLPDEGSVIASEAKQSSAAPSPAGLLRRLAPRNDGSTSGNHAPVAIAARGPLPSAGSRFIEPVETDSLPVLLFGAGHVGRAIVARADGLPLAIAWYDSRAEMAEIPGAVFAEEEAMAVQAAQAPDDSAVVIMTHDHALDYRLTAAALSSRARLVGLIGSKTKRARFLSRLAADGIDAERLTCPVGLPGISGREPETIAIAVLAQLLMLRSP